MDPRYDNLNLQGCANLAQEVITHAIEDRYRMNSELTPRQRGEQLLIFSNHKIIGLVCSVFGYDEENWRNKIRIKALKKIEYAARQEEQLRGNNIPIPMRSRST